MRPIQWKYVCKPYARRINWMSAHRHGRWTIQKRGKTLSRRELKFYPTSATSVPYVVIQHVCSLRSSLRVRVSAYVSRMRGKEERSHFFLSSFFHSLCVIAWSLNIRCQLSITEFVAHPLPFLSRNTCRH